MKGWRNRQRNIWEREIYRERIIYKSRERKAGGGLFMPVPVRAARPAAKRVEVEWP